MKLHIRALIAIVAIAFAGLSCSQPFLSKHKDSSTSSSGGAATVKLSLSLPDSATSSSSAKGLGVSSVSLRAHSNDTSATDTVQVISVSSSSTVTTLSFAAGSWTFTAEATDYYGNIGYSGTKTVTLVTGSQSLAISLFELSGSLEVTAILPSGVTVPGWVVSALRAHSDPVTAGMSASSPTTTLTGVPVGTWNVVVETVASNDLIYQGVAKATVTSGAATVVSVSVSGSSVSPTVVFVPASTSDLKSFFHDARYATTNFYTPILFKLASGSFSLSDGWWDIPNAFYSGGWSDSTTRPTGATTTLALPSNSVQVSLAKAALCGMENLTVDGGSVSWQPLKIQGRSFALLNGVKVINVLAANPDDSADLGGAKALGVYDGSYASISDSSFAGGLDFWAPNYQSDQWIIIENSSFVGGTSSISYGDASISKSTFTYEPAANWDAAVADGSDTGIEFLHLENGKSFSIDSSTFTIAAGASSKGSAAASSNVRNVNAIVVEHPTDCSVTIEGCTVNFGFAGKAPTVYHRAFAAWNIGSGASISILNNALTNTTSPDGADVGIKFIELGTSLSSRDSIAIDVEGNTFDGKAKSASSSSWLNFIEQNSDASGSGVNADTLDVFKSNAFIVSSGGQNTNILTNNASNLDAYDSAITTKINDPADTTFLTSGSAGGNTVTN